MNLRFGLIFAGLSLVSWLEVCDVSAQSGNKPILLRNETIQAGPAPAAAFALNRTALPNDPATVSGLFLVQFTGSLEPTWREALRLQNVELLRYVPEDAFVARCRVTPLELVRQLPFVRLVEPYRSEHKVHPKLLPGPPADAQPLVTLLFSPGSTALELAEAKACLDLIQQESRPRFGAVVRGRVAAGQWTKLVESPAVLWIEPAPIMKLLDEVSARILLGNGSNGGTYVHQLGFDGTGVRVAVADSGLHSGQADTMHPDLAGRVTRLIAYGNLPNAADEHGHGTHMTGILAGGGVIDTLDEQGHRFGLGVAPGASIVAQRIFNGAGDYVLEFPFGRLTADAWDAGAEIASNSWGYDTHGDYDVAAAEFDELVRDASPADGDQGLLMVFSAGNAGPAPGTIGSPAVAKNVIAVGASQNDRVDFLTYADGREAMADFSSRGPSYDGRIKPDLVAPGTWVASLRSPVGSDGNAWQTIDADYLFMGGTSQAAPHVAGAAAIFCQYYREIFPSGGPSPALIKAALIHSAHNLQSPHGTPIPNMVEGWGRPDLTEMVQSPESHVFLDQTVPLSGGQSFETTSIIASSDKPLRVTMAYTDAPGFPPAVLTLVNDLDLEMVAPDGHVFRGNQMEAGESVADASGNDLVNNVEVISLRHPVPGEYRVRVRARRVVEDSCVTVAGLNQDFALAMSGAIPSPRTAVVLLDRAFYTAPAQIGIRLFDLDLAGQPFVVVKACSATEPLGQTVSLSPGAGAGAFTGLVATARGSVPVAADGRLQISDGDWIRVSFIEAAEQRTNSATAVADLVAPSLLDVAVTEQFGRVVVVWQTLEPASSLIRYGTNPDNLVQVLADNALSGSHALELTNLVAGLTYYFEVSSTDAAGNASTNNNGGTFFRHLATAAKTVLLVDDHRFVPGDVWIPPNAYTDALEATGVSFEVWTTTERGSYPTYNDLRAYQIVIWRINDSVNAPTDGIAAAERGALQQYIDSGGSFLMTSMQILSRLFDQGGSNFVRNVLHVDRFVRSTDPMEHCLDCDEDFQVETALGAANDLIGDGLQLALDYTSYPDGDPLPTGPDFADTFGPSTNATACVFESVSGKACGLRFPRTGDDSLGRSVFLAFPLDAVPMSGSAPNTRSEVLHRALRFLSPGLGGLGTIAFHRSQYRIPDLVTIEVADSDLAGNASLTVNVSSTTVPTPILVTLRETARPGLFRGSVQLISASNPQAPGHLRAFDGDLLLAQYADASAAAPAQTSALVDIMPPLIFALEVLPGYSEATIRWETDEPTDALVQFGESVFLGRTAYSPGLATQHSITFRKLIPDRGYFFKIASRDAAGNVTDEDNNGRPFTFDTLPPFPAPYLNDMELGSAGWKVETVPGTEFGWQLVPPNNGFVAFANSPIYAWASNPLGDPATRIDSSLISPPIALEGGNVATVRFSHAYDFQRQSHLDVSDTGRLLLVTNPLSPPVILAEYTGTSSNWEEESIDLTPYVGRAIFLIWHHRLESSFEAFRPGWALDDLSVTVEFLTPGIIHVTNNLVRARVTLAGPTSRLAQGNFTSFAGLPPGRYVATWAPVPYYQTPLPQTLDLPSGELRKISGTYTFTDANNNQMSDAWETEFFGAASPERTRLIDTDGDGVTDYAEFLGGTDPTRVDSCLRLLTPVVMPAGQRLQLQWPTVPGRAYRLEGSSNRINWAAVGDWTQAVGTVTTRSVPIPTKSPFLFRVGVRP